MQIGTWKRTARVARFAEARNRLARQPEIKELRHRVGELQPQPRFDELHPFAAVSDAVAEHHHALRRHERAGRRSRHFATHDRHEPHLADIHDGRGLLALRLDGEGMLAGGRQRHPPEPARDEVLEMARLLDDEREPLATDLDRDVAAAVPVAAALPDLDLERARLRDGELPVGPVGGVHPVAEAILVRRRLIAHHHAVRGRLAGAQQNFAGGLLNDWLTFRRGPECERTQVKVRMAHRLIGQRHRERFRLRQVNPTHGCRRGPFGQFGTESLSRDADLNLRGFEAGGVQHHVVTAPTRGFEIPLPDTCAERIERQQGLPRRRQRRLRFADHPRLGRGENDPSIGQLFGGEGVRQETAQSQQDTEPATHAKGFHARHAAVRKRRKKALHY